MWPFLSPRQRLIRRALRLGLRALDRDARAIELWTDHDEVLLVIRRPGSDVERVTIGGGS
jgi:hypothetical protein